MQVAQQLPKQRNAQHRAVDRQAERRPLKRLHKQQAPKDKGDDNHPIIIRQKRRYANDDARNQRQLLVNIVELFDNTRDH